MYTNTKIQIDEQAIREPENINILLATAEEIINATENDYNYIRKKSAFERFTELITLSKDDVKILARNIKNLSAMQAIVLKLLVMLSKDCQKIAQWLIENEVIIEKLSSNDTRLAKGLLSVKKEILRIKYGYYERPDITSISDKNRFIIISTVREFIKRSGKSNSNTQKYMRFLRKAMPCSYKSNNFDYKFIEDIENPKEHELLFIILSEIFALMDKIPAEEYNEVIKHIAISDTRKESIKKDIEKMIEIEGKKFVAHFYELYIDDNQVDLIREEDVEYDEEQASESINFVDANNQNDYSQIRKLILERFMLIAPEEKKESKKKSQNKRMQIFIQKVTPRVVPETAIAYADCSLLGACDAGILFTTSGLHYKSLNKNAVSFRYDEIDFKNSKLLYDKEKIKSLSIALKDKKRRIVISEKVIKKDLLLDLLNDISASSISAPDDTPAYINDVDEDLKVLCIKALLNMFIECKQDIAEVLRFASDMKVSEKGIEKILKYAENPDEELNNLLVCICKASPYPSKLSIGYALIVEFVRLLQMEKRRIEITAIERKCIKMIVDYYGINNEVIDKLIICAQIPYRIVNDDISIKDINRLNKDLAETLIGTGIPFVTVFGSSTFFWDTWLGFFMIGIGGIINTLFGSIIVTREAINEFLQECEYRNYRNKLIQDIIYSYYIAIGFFKKVHFEDISLDIEKNIKKLEESLKLYLLNTEHKFIMPEQYNLIIEKIKDVIKNDNYASGNFYVSPDIPTGIVNKAIKNITFEEQVTQIIAIIDSTISGSLRCGIVFTNKGLYFKKAINQPKKYINYADIKDIDIKRKRLYNYITIFTNSGYNIKWDDFPLLQASLLYTIITNILKILKS